MPRPGTGRLLGGITELARRSRRSRTGSLNLQTSLNTSSVPGAPQVGQQSTITKGPTPIATRTGALRGAGSGGGTNVLGNEQSGGTLSSAVQAGNTANAGNTSRATPVAGSPTGAGSQTAAQIGAQQRQAQISVNLAAQAKLKKKKGSAPGSLSQASI